MASINLQGDTSGSISISAPSVAGSNTLTLPATTQTLATQNALGVRNRIINGDMRIDQRNAGASKSVSGNDIYTLDRYKGWANGGGVFSVQQSSTAPANFTNSALLTVTTADSSVAASDNYRWAQPIEGYNVADLAFGTSDAKTITVSFWVRSNLTGTYGGAIYSTTASRSYVYQYTINSADTWEQKTVTIEGDTSGSWNTTNGNGMVVYFDLGSGSTYQNAVGSWVSGEKFSTSGNANWIGTLSNNLYITGVQLEVGDTATPFEHRPYDMELARCQRYYQVMSKGAIGGSYSSTQWIGGGNFNTQMRATPSASQPNGVATVHDPSTATYAQSSVNITATYASTTGSTFILGNFSGMTSFRPMELFGGEIHLSSEL